VTDNNHRDSGDGQRGQDQASEHHSFVHAIQTLDEHYESAQRERAQHENAVLGWQRRTGIGVGIYTLLTIPIAIAGVCAAIAAQRSANLVHDNFLIDRRPYIWLTNDLGTPQSIRVANGNVQVTWEWNFTNYGKTLSVHTHSIHFISLNGEPFQPSYGPNEQGPEIGIPVPPTMTPRRAVVSRPVTDEILTKALATNLGISISGIIDYEDDTGKKYESAFCIGRLATGAIEYREPSENCKNEIK
jgi:hypothetical protein